MTLVYIIGSMCAINENYFSYLLNVTSSKGIGHMPTIKKYHLNSMCVCLNINYFSYGITGHLKGTRADKNRLNWMTTIFCIKGTRYWSSINEKNQLIYWIWYPRLNNRSILNQKVLISLIHVCLNDIRMYNWNTFSDTPKNLSLIECSMCAVYIFSLPPHSKLFFIKRYFCPTYNRYLALTLRSKIFPVFIKWLSYVPELIAFYVNLIIKSDSMSSMCALKEVNNENRIDMFCCHLKMMCTHEWNFILRNEIFELLWKGREEIIKYEYFIIW